jgi:hypothetical protein
MDMSRLLNAVDPWIAAALFALSMLAGWAVGWWRGRSLRQEARESPPHKLSDAILALLGLLLGFTFAMSLGKHDHRREMVVADSIAIGDFYTCVSLLKEPVRGKLQALVRKYLEHRLPVGHFSMDEAALQRKLDEIQEMHHQMQLRVGEAVDGGTPVVVPLVNTFNALTSSHAARLAAGRDRLPGVIVLLLFLAAVLSMAVVGKQQGAAKAWRPGSSMGFAVLVCMVVWVTLDLDQPDHGWIAVSQEPLQRLLKGMEK